MAKKTDVNIVDGDISCNMAFGSHIAEKNYKSRASGPYE
jgi:hypothetical protein